jgi:Protein of unknown function (DUF1524)
MTSHSPAAPMSPVADEPRRRAAARPPALVAAARKPAPGAVRALVAAALLALLAVVDVGLLAVSVTPLWGSPVGDSARLRSGLPPAISFIGGQPAGLVLAQLQVRDRDPLGYHRSAFGEQGWIELQGCDTRNQMLRRDLTDVVIRPGTEGCVVESGVLRDPYSDATVTFVRGPATSPLTPVDHVVSLADAYRAGAARWPLARRRAFTNDPQNLLVTTASVNAAGSSWRSRQPTSCRSRRPSATHSRGSWPAARASQPEVRRDQPPPRPTPAGCARPGTPGQTAPNQPSCPEHHPPGACHAVGRESVELCTGERHEFTLQRP